MVTRSQEITTFNYPSHSKMNNKLLTAYTKVVDRLRDFPQADLSDDERCAIILENVVDEFSLNDELLTEDEWHDIYDKASFYLHVTLDVLAQDPRLS